MEIDLNCDLGEGYPHDAELMPLITSANISCGFHAGDVSTAHRALRLAHTHRVQVGAHPGYADREHLGRREQEKSEEQIYEEGIYQVGALYALARAVGVPLAYIKAHGALYNQACREDAFARPVLAVAEFFSLPVLGLPGSRLEALCAKVPFIAEGFADRRYQPDGSLVPRTQADAFVHNAAEAVEQSKWLLRTRGVRTLCVHGDNPQAVDFVRQLRSALLEQGFSIRAFLAPGSQP